MVLITDGIVVSEPIGLVPPQVAEQPPPLGARMNASWKAFWPVASITVETFGGELSSGIRYGAEAYQLLLSAVELGAAWPAVARAMVVPAARARAAVGKAKRR